MVIEIGTASFRSTRGYSYAAVLCDEIAFLAIGRDPRQSGYRDHPGPATRNEQCPSAILLLASSPYAKRGELYNAYRKHFGKDDVRVLVWQGPTLTMNPRVDPTIIADALAEDPQAAKAEYFAEFRDDLADYVTREIVDAVTMWGRADLPPEAHITYQAFVDPSGGISDAMTLAIGHLSDGAVCVLDRIVEIYPPFDPEQAVRACASVLREYRVSTAPARRGDPGDRHRARSGRALMVTFNLRQYVIPNWRYRQRMHYPAKDRIAQH